jgi:antitoxin component YwqK of YwqJK toxin-antitoxin module
MFYPGNRPEQFITYNDSGKQHGWEVRWYENGNVKDSTLYNNGVIAKGLNFYHNGKPSVIISDMKRRTCVSSISYNTTGKIIGQVINGNGTLIDCDSLGGNCHTLVYKDGKRVFK